ncbi:hypothetical protein BY458DRAFT_504262 [Sporodiniella umbellata]|nr:hypothetical protein BY458DRAFT_504262 [Sporodiniella umbellata]
MQTKELFSMKECHTRAEKAYEDWGQVLRHTVRMASCQEDLDATIRAFVQVDALSKNTKASLGKSNRALDLVLERKPVMSDVLTDLEEIQHLLDVERTMKENWHPSPN